MGDKERIEPTLVGAVRLDCRETIEIATVLLNEAF